MKWLIFLIFILSIISNCSNQKSILIQLAQNPSNQGILAAKEIKRYIYQRTGQILPVIYNDTLSFEKGNILLLSDKHHPVVQNIKKN